MSSGHTPGRHSSGQGREPTSANVCSVPKWQQDLEGWLWEAEGMRLRDRNVEDVGRSQIYGTTFRISAERSTADIYSVLNINAVTVVHFMPRCVENCSLRAKQETSQVWIPKSRTSINYLAFSCPKHFSHMLFSMTLVSAHAQVFLGKSVL